MIECKELIITDLERRGTGKEITSPVRSITQVFDKSGNLLAEKDPNGNFTIEDMISYAIFYNKEKGTIRDWLNLPK